MARGDIGSFTGYTLVSTMASPPNGKATLDANEVQQLVQFGLLHLTRCLESQSSAGPSQARERRDISSSGIQEALV